MSEFGGLQKHEKIQHGDRQADGHQDIDRKEDSHAERQIGRHDSIIHTKTDVKTDKEDGQIDINEKRQAGRLEDTETGSYEDRWVDRQVDKQTDRKTDR